jgi:metal-dependent amidase/aminoacylase/carboxypeptidase family protein
LTSHFLEIGINNLKEQEEWEYKSKIDGKIDYCGHYNHVAMLFGAAKLTHSRKDKLKVSSQPSNILLL